MKIQIIIDCELEGLLDNVEYCKHLVAEHYCNIQENVLSDLEVGLEINDSNCSGEINISILG